MFHSIDLRFNSPRSAYEELGGVKLLARIVDKGRAAIGGTLGSYIFFDCPLDQIFFDAVKASRNEFLQVLRQTFASHLTANAEALADLRESPECKPEISDEFFFEFAEARDADRAVLRWLTDQRHTPPSVLAAINEVVDALPPEVFNDQINDESFCLISYEMSTSQEP